MAVKNQLLTIFVKNQQFALPVSTNLMKFLNLLHNHQISAHAAMKETREILSLYASVVTRKFILMDCLIPLGVPGSWIETKTKLSVFDLTYELYIVLLY